MSVDTYEQMTTGVSDITSIALVTLEIINNTLLINELRLWFVCRELMGNLAARGLRLAARKKLVKMRIRLILVVTKNLKKIHRAEVKILARKHTSQTPCGLYCKNLPNFKGH